jgi:hypothetical protein
MHITVYLAILSTAVQQALATALHDQQIENVLEKRKGYYLTCTNYALQEGHILSAQCKNNAKQYVFTSVDLNNCMNNNNAKLYVSLRTKLVEL